jgi:hypothetical protein
VAGNQGTATLDFGAFPGTDTATVAVADAAIGAAALVEAWVFPAATTDHSADEHVVESFKVVARDVVAGVGFSVQGFSTFEGRFAGNAFRVYGKWNIAWVWNQ